MPPEQCTLWECIRNDFGNAHVGQKHELFHKLVGLPLHCKTALQPNSHGADMSNRQKGQICVVLTQFLLFEAGP